MGSLFAMQTVSNMALGAELFALGLLIFMLAYVILRLLMERREHGGKKEDKQTEREEPPKFGED